MITELEIAIISIEKSNMSRGESREFISELSDQDIYVKLDKIIEKLDEQKVETAKIILTTPKSVQVMTNQKPYVISNPNMILLP